MKVKKLQTRMAILGAVLALAGLQVMAQPPLFLIVDEDSIDNGTNCSVVDFVTASCVSIEECASGSCPGVSGPPIDNDPAVLVNDDISSIPGVLGGCQAVLPINSIAGLPGMPLITLPTGQVGDEGLFLPAQDAFKDLPEGLLASEGLSAYINCTPSGNPPPFPLPDDHVPVQDVWVMQTHVAAMFHGITVAVLTAFLASFLSCHLSRAILSNRPVSC